MGVVTAEIMSPPRLVVVEGREVAPGSRTPGASMSWHTTGKLRQQQGEAAEPVAFCVLGTSRSLMMPCTEAGMDD